MAPGQPGASLMRWLAVLLGCLLWSLPARAADGLAPPQQVLQAASDALLTALAAKRGAQGADPTRVQALVREYVLPHVDFERFSGLAVGRAWRRATAEQRARFVAEFERLLVRTYATGLVAFETWEIRYPPQRIAADADDVLVRTEVLRRGAQPVPVDYRMHCDEGRWRVYDVVVEGVSFASTYRTSFEQEVRQAGIDGLIDRLSELNDLRSGASSPPS